MEIETIEYAVEETPSIEVSESPITYGNTTVVTHGSLIDKNNDNQHTINAITGLSEKLNQLEALKPVQSNGKGYAEYYKWNGGNPTLEDRIGRFVSFCVDANGNGTDLIKTSNENVFGVTISSNDAAFIGNQNAETPRDTSYGLVCYVGTVKVVCADDVKVNDRVKPGKVGDKDGGAIKDENGHYLVTAVEHILGATYATINFVSSIGAIIDEITVHRASEAVNYDADEGTIKAKFDDIDNEIEYIKGGDTVVAEANHTVYADDYNTSKGTIKTKFDDMENGNLVIGKAKMDRNGKVLDENYYYLHNINKDSNRYINSKFDLNSLYKPSQCGIYIIHFGVVKDISNLPTDAAFPTEGGEIKLIVEGSLGDDSFPTVFQTLKIRGRMADHNKRLLIYHRVVSAIANGSPVWTDWQRFVSASELENGDLTVKNSDMATNDIEGNEIRNSYGFLGATPLNSDRCIDSLTFDIDSLCKISDCGTYAFPRGHFDNGDEYMLGFPDEVRQDRMNIGGAKLTVEADVEENETSYNIYQTLKISMFENKFDRVNIYHRVYNSDSAAWSAWSRFVSVEELSNHVLYLHSYRLGILRHSIQRGKIRLNINTYGKQAIVVREYLSKRNFVNYLNAYPASGEVYEENGSLTGIITGIYADQYASTQGQGSVNTIGYTYLDLSDSKCKYQTVGEDWIIRTDAYNIEDV